SGGEHALLVLRCAGRHSGERVSVGCHVCVSRTRIPESTRRRNVDNRQRYRHGVRVDQPARAGFSDPGRTGRLRMAGPTPFPPSPACPPPPRSPCSPPLSTAAPVPADLSRCFGIVPYETCCTLISAGWM